MNRLHGKQALITGGTTGIGLETARQFMAEGARVIVTGVNPQTLKEARAALGSDVDVVASNSSSVTAQKELAAFVRQKFGHLDVLFLNAGISVWQPIEDWTEEAFDKSFAINVKGPYFLVQALIPVFTNPASIILNTSINAHVGAARSSVYSATKAALLSFTRTLSGELLSRGVRVNAVSPGPVETPLYDKLEIPAAYREQVNQDIVRTIPFGRFGKPAEVAKAVVHLASEESAWTVGAELIVDGGRMLNG